MAIGQILWLDSLKLTTPRRVYMNTHIEYRAESIIRLYQKRNTIRGLKMVNLVSDFNEILMKIFCDHSLST